MNELELTEDLEGAKLVILRLNEMLRQQQAEILAGKIMIKGYSKIIDEQQAEIEALKSKLNKYHLKEDLDRNLDLIYGKEFIK